MRLNWFDFRNIITKSGGTFPKNENHLIKICPRYERQLAYINQEMENECVEMQEDAPEEFTDDCCGRYKCTRVVSRNVEYLTRASVQ